MYETVSFVEDIKNDLNSDKHLLLTLNRNNELVPIFNKSHSLFQSLFDSNGFKNEKVEKLVHTLRFAVRDTLTTIINKWSNSDDLQLHKLLYTRNYALILKSVFKHEPTLLPMLHSNFMGFWISAKKLNLIEKDRTLPEITVEDFPWHWNAEV